MVLVRTVFQVREGHIRDLVEMMKQATKQSLLKWFKRWFNESYDARGKWEWQQGGFDRLLRTSESVHEKWNYIRENPVRAALVTHWKHWPYHRAFFRC